jgi:succinoglycan biosynthesis protein ExoA
VTCLGTRSLKASPQAVPQKMSPDKSESTATKCAPAGCSVSTVREESFSDAANPERPQDLAPLVSVIVPCRNEANSIHAFLGSLLSQETDGIRWEAVIADGMSEDGTRGIVWQFARSHPQIRVIDNPGLIVSTGLNACIRASKGAILVRMDVHTEYKSDYLLRCVEVLERTNAANVGGACIAVQTGYVGRAIAAAFHSPFAVGGAQWHQPGYEGYVDTVHLGCWRREVLEQAGGFDETLVRNQDDELNLRLTRNGGKIWQSPEIVSWYHPRSSLAALFRQYFQYGFWKVAVIRKHGQPASWRHLVPGVFVLANLVLLALVLLEILFGRGPLSDFMVAGIAMDAAYAGAVLTASFRLAKKDGWKLFPVLVPVFVTFHVAYGLGFLAGIFHFLTAPRRSRHTDAVTTGLAP